MERKGNRIIFNEDEQLSFSVAPDVDITSALQTADSFLEAAANISGRASSLPSGIVNPEVTMQRDRLQMRANELSRFAALIHKLCMPEIAQQMIDSLEARQ